MGNQSYICDTHHYIEALRKPPMKIGFTVGEIEQHDMELSFDQTSGDLLIMMDGTKVLQDSRALAIEPIRRYEINVGDDPMETSPGTTPRLSLMVTAVGEHGIVPRS
jgi:hypothetical protein